MKLDSSDLNLLKKLMISSAKKGNLATAAIAIENHKVIASSESLVASNHDATYHAERKLVEIVCNQRKSNYTPGLTMVTVVEPCVMCLSACSWAGYKQLAYIIPAARYISKIPYMAETLSIDKVSLAQSFTDPVELIQLKELEVEFMKVFEDVMSDQLK
jgi:tRNA(Arg) A34 adenosine deaminase TadA